MSFVLTALTLFFLYFLAGLAGTYTYRRLGLISVAQGAVLGTAAYAFALLEANEVPVYLAAFAAVVGAACVGAVAVGLSERVVGEDYALLTFALQMMWSGVVSNWTALTRGPLGIAGVGVQISLGSAASRYVYAAASAIGAIGILWIAHRQEKSLFSNGAAVVARSSELASTVGLKPLATRVQVGLASGAVAGSAGLLFALFVTFVHPSSFGIDLSVLILAISFFGLTGSLGKVLLGTAFLVLVPELARFAGMPGARAGYLQLLLAGIAVCMGAVVFLRRNR